MTEFAAVLVFAISSAVASTIYALKNIKSCTFCGCSSCEQDTHDNKIPNDDIELGLEAGLELTTQKLNQINELKKQIQDLTEVIITLQQ